MFSKRGESGTILKDTTIYIILLVLFVAGMVYYVGSQRDGAAKWSDIYAKEIVNIINRAEVGDKVSLDVQRMTAISKKNDVPFEQVFVFDNNRKEVCVKGTTRRACYSYFSDLNVTDVNLELGVPINILNFNIGRAK